MSLQENPETKILFSVVLITIYMQYRKLRKTKSFVRFCKILKKSWILYPFSTTYRQTTTLRIHAITAPINRHKAAMYMTTVASGTTWKGNSESLTIAQLNTRPLDGQGREVCAKYYGPGMCNIWVIQRRNVIFRAKTSPWSTFSLSKLPDMMSLDEF